MKKVKIVYYSGTGGTQRVAESFVNNFQKIGMEVSLTSLFHGQEQKKDSADLLVLIYAVYAMNAPLPVDEWLAHIEKVGGTKAVVISVSGGGEVSPNTACRRKVMKQLHAKGYQVIYDKMIIMPSNWIVHVPDNIAKRMLEVMPIKVEKIIDDIVNGKKVHSRQKLFDRFLSIVGEAEKAGGKMFGRKIIVGEECVACGNCVKGCPRGNWTIKDGKPIAGDQCIICLNCFYACPKHALKPGTAKFFIIKEGYDLNRIEKLEHTELSNEEIDAQLRGIIWSGVRAYLKNPSRN